MKKLVLFLPIILVILSACSDKGSYTISGNASDSGLEGKQVYLVRESADNQEIIKSDTTSVVNGKFSFKGVQPDPAVYTVFLETGSGERPVKEYILIEPGKFSVTIEEDRIKIGGSPENDEYQRNNDSLKILMDQMYAIQENYTSLPEEQQTPEALKIAQDKYMLLADQMKETNLNYMKNSIHNPLGVEIFKATRGMYDPEDLSGLISQLDDSTKAKEPFKSMLEEFEVLNKVAVGKKFSDITLKDPDDKEVSLSRYVGTGKYVLIDFWASWCGPCIREMPTLINAYNLYKDKNFEIVGISLDDDKNEWTQSMSNLKIGWPQMSDLKGWKSDAATLYGVRSIPHTILTDPEGMIIAKNIRGEELLEKLKEVLK